jgi:hypothetical protein
VRLLFADRVVADDVVARLVGGEAGMVAPDARDAEGGPTVEP